METSVPEKILCEHGVRPSRRRRAILAFLMENPVHPTAEDVYRALCGEIKTLSRTTVYNTLRKLCSCGAAQMITLEENEMRFDATTLPHGHFKCTRCGKIFDFPCAALPQTLAALPDGFSVQETQLYVHGVCKDCRASEKESGASE